ncbi:hypothetical protein [Streptomyces sp. NPDC014894]|uniref:hypothetical protein n=1 Tax=unclassified Streptomyces TaxID=2593676 RepID=UPI0037010269
MSLRWKWILGVAAAVVALIVVVSDSWITALLTIGLVIAAVVGWFMLRVEYGEPNRPRREPEPPAYRDARRGPDHRPPPH